MGKRTLSPRWWAASLGVLVGGLIPCFILARAALRDIEFSRPVFNCGVLTFGGSLKHIFNVPRRLAPTAPPPLSSPPPLPSPLPQSDPYTELFKASQDVCTRPGKNVVLARGDGINNFTFLPRVRPWSLHSHTYHLDPSLSPCSSPPALLESLRFGRRLPTKFAANGKDGYGNATHFAPHGCNYKWYTAHEACEIASRYFSLTILGDSLSRHHTQGLLMLLTQDLIYGATRFSSQRVLYDNCVCDGQFSEHEFCRKDNGRMFKMLFPPTYGVCSTHPDFQFKYSAHETNFSYLCSPDPRPRFLLFQGGVHQHSEANKTIAMIIDPTMALLNQAIAECEHKFPVRVVWSGINSQATFMDVKYSHQSDAHAVVFQRVASEYVRAAYDVDWMDFVNMTRNASVSDGLHYLTEVNLLKATYLLNLMDLYAKPAATV